MVLVRVRDARRAIACRFPIIATGGVAHANASRVKVARIL
jgi:hypothetical protein